MSEIEFSADESKTFKLPTYTCKKHGTVQGCLVVYDNDKPPKHFCLGCFVDLLEDHGLEPLEED